MGRVIGKNNKKAWLEDGMLKGTKTILCGLACATALTGSAMAGGFSRGTADTDILFEDGNFAMRSGVLYVAPQRGYETIGGGAATDGAYSDAYAVPSVAVKMNLHDSVSCAGTYTDAFGASASYGPQAIAIGRAADNTGTITEGFTSSEFGMTCGAHFNAGNGRFWILGGGFLQNFNYSQTVSVAPLGNTNATLSFNDRFRPGYRIGAAYEIPEIALRAQIMYRSAVEHTPSSAEGSFVTQAAGSSSASGNGTLPRSVELKLQSGIAPEWLAFGSVKWTDWSALQTLNYTIDGTPLAGNYQLDYFWRDGWTVTGGIGHAFNDMVSGSLSLTWDKGVSTTEDAHTDTWTLATGLSVKGDRSEFRFGGAVTHLAGKSIAADPVPGNPGNSFAYTVGGDWSYALGANFRVSF
jgi:long-chain fatty acid transport protein